MKRLIIIIALLLNASYILAQHELDRDSIHGISIDDIYIPDGYLIDMKMILPAPPSLVPPQFNWQDLNKEVNFYDVFNFKDNSKYGTADFYFSPTPAFGSLGWNSNIINLQQATFKLKNGMTISTYGEYDAFGNKKYNPSALPWQKNNFNGAFEMKSRNGNFGIRIEVQRGRDTAY